MLAVSERQVSSIVSGGKSSSCVELRKDRLSERFRPVIPRFLFLMLSMSPATCVLAHLLTLMNVSTTGAGSPPTRATDMPPLFINTSTEVLALVIAVFSDCPYTVSRKEVRAMLRRRTTLPTCRRSKVCSSWTCTWFCSLLDCRGGRNQNVTLKFEQVSSPTVTSHRSILYPPLRTNTSRRSGLVIRAQRKFGVGVCGYMERRCCALGRFPSDVTVMAEGTCITRTWLSTGEGLLNPDVVVPNEVAKNDEELTVWSAATSCTTWDESSVS